MLVLARKPGQTIHLIGLEVVIHQFEGGRIGIEAPDDVKVLRGELVEEPGKAAEEPASPVVIDRAA